MCMVVEKCDFPSTDDYFLYITKTCPCNSQIFFSTVKIENFIRKVLINSIVLIKFLIVGTR